MLGRETGHMQLDFPVTIWDVREVVVALGVRYSRDDALPLRGG